MQAQVTRFFPDLDPRTGVLVLDGFGIKLLVRHGHLVLTDGIGDERRERRLSRPARDVRRIVVVGHDGFVTLEALRWLDRVGVGLVLLDVDGRPLMTSWMRGRDHAGLRRTQARLAGTNVGVALARGLLVRKLTGQATVLQRLGMTAAVLDLERLANEANHAAEIEGVLIAEAIGAKTYWEAVANVPVRFPKADIPIVPEHWLTFGGRRSGVTGRNRDATNPSNAMLNYMYRLAEVETTFTVSTLGLDPGLGIWHVDAANRDSLSLDLLEAVRPQVDWYLFELLAARPLLRKYFYETPQGVCRVLPPLTHELAETMPMLASWIAPIAEEVARAIGEVADQPVSVGSVLTGDRMSESKASTRKGTRVNARVRPRRRPSACRMCGEILAEVDRVVCDACLPAYDEERTAKLASAGRRALVSMRSSPDDPAKSPEARAKRAARSREVMLANRAWERKHGRAFDAERYEQEVLPRIRVMSIPALAAAPGLSSYYLWRVRQGERRLHPRHWERVRELGSGRAGPGKAVGNGSRTTETDPVTSPS